jgi:hypothetical protein
MIGLKGRLQLSRAEKLAPLDRAHNTDPSLLKHAWNCGVALRFSIDDAGQETIGRSANQIEL